MVDGQENASTKSKFQWTSYSNFRFLLWAWMMNDTSVVFAPAEVSLMGFYVHICLTLLSVVFIGIPILYSEICIAQYTNCNLLSMWDFCPLFRYVGFATVYLVCLKIIYVLVLTSWYLQYAFFAAFDPPPWHSCSEFNDTQCMVKNINISVFQHCLEAAYQFDEDCGMKTASNCFFEREIGGYLSGISFSCMLPWKTLIASSTVSFIIYILSIKRQKFIHLCAKLLAAYVCMVLLILFCVTLSTSGTWYASVNVMDWYQITSHDLTHSMNRGCLCLGTGCGIILFLSQNAPFRSPATMTSISIPIFALFLSVIFTLVAFSGVKTMIYFHGEEPNVIEIGSSIYFVVFACISEIMNYFDGTQLWGFAWFSAIYFCLLVNLWIMYMFLKILLLKIEIANKYEDLSCAILMVCINICSWPFFCSDLTAVLTDICEIMQITNNLIFSFALYWVYGFNNHNIDIIFMIGVKASYFWKLCWLLNPIFFVIILYSRWVSIEVEEYDTSYYVESLGMEIDLVLVYILLAGYHLIIFIGIFYQMYSYYRQGNFSKLFSPTVNWGPQDKIFLKSRKMFLPEIMTTEFLYRQIRIRGYGQKKSKTVSKPRREASNEDSIDFSEWGASN